LVTRTSRYALGLRMSKYFMGRHAGLDRRCVWIGGEHRGIRPQISNVASFNDFWILAHHSTWLFKCFSFSI